MPLQEQILKCIVSDDYQYNKPFESISPSNSGWCTDKNSESIFGKMIENDIAKAADDIYQAVIERRKQTKLKRKQTKLKKEKNRVSNSIHKNWALWSKLRNYPPYLVKKLEECFADSLLHSYYGSHKEYNIELESILVDIDQKNNITGPACPSVLISHLPDYKRKENGKYKCGMNKVNQAMLAKLNKKNRPNSKEFSKALENLDKNLSEFDQEFVAKEFGPLSKEVKKRLQRAKCKGEEK